MKKLNRYFLIIPFLIACSDPRFPTKDEYLAVRSTNNELGVALTKYHDNVVSYAQKDVNIESAMRCKTVDLVCREQVKSDVLKHYETKESEYNRFAEVQSTVAQMCRSVDKTCVESTEEFCEESKQKVLRRGKEVLDAYNKVLDWIK